ncbi:MAG: hypothetical protein UGF45_02035, partial [Massilioclostridium sp.]|nr:hypothetical protein [Massilioclostridium sp.]
ISVQIPHDTGISMLCVAGLRYLSEKTSLYFVGAVGRPHFYDTRGAFHYIILFTLPGKAGGCCFAKANQDNESENNAEPVFKTHKKCLFSLFHLQLLVPVKQFKTIKQ